MKTKSNRLLCDGPGLKVIGLLCDGPNEQAISKCLLNEWARCHHPLVQLLIVSSERCQTCKPSISLCFSLREVVLTVANLVSLSFYSLIIWRSVLIWSGSEVSPFSLSQKKRILGQFGLYLLSSEGSSGTLPSYRTSFCPLATPKNSPRDCFRQSFPRGWGQLLLPQPRLTCRPPVEEDGVTEKMEKHALVRS